MFSYFKMANQLLGNGRGKNSHFCERPTLSDHMVQSANPIMQRKFDKLIEREINRKNVRSSQYPFFASCYLLFFVQYTMLDKNSTHRDGSGWPGGNLVDMSEFSSFISCSLYRFCTAFKTASLFSWSFQSSTKIAIQSTLGFATMGKAANLALATRTP